MVPEQYHSNGLTWPTNRYQVGSVLGLSVLSVAFYVLIVPRLQAEDYQLAVSGYSIGLAAVALCGLMATIADPTDIGVKHKRDPARHPATITIEAFPKVCLKCQARVTLESTHCSLCDRCVERFDHHCRWINNCIGQRNYMWFLGLVVGLEVTMGVGVLAGGRVVRGLTGEEAGLVLGAMLGDVLVLISNGCLLLFHVYLRTKHLSTYEFVRAARFTYVKTGPSHFTTGTRHTSIVTINDSNYPSISQPHSQTDFSGTISRKDRIKIHPESSLMREDYSKADLEEGSMRSTVNRLILIRREEKATMEQPETHTQV